MCILLVTTAHPSYSVIILDNRDEFILRPTSHPHWWQSSSGQKVLSSRDLQRKEQGTWLGITSTGNMAVLTNYRETDWNDTMSPIQGTRSRGAMVTAWLEAPPEETVDGFVKRLLGDKEGGVAGVGGFSLLTGKLRKQKGKAELEPMAIISNRCKDQGDVPWIASTRGEVHGLSNTTFSDPDIWPKVRIGKERTLEVVEEAISKKFSEDELVDKLWGVLDIDTLPKQEGKEFEDYLFELRKSIFIPGIGKEDTPHEMPKADEIASANPRNINGHGNKEGNGVADTKLKQDERPDPPSNAMTGIYGTQRQTVILVDWEGNVKFHERSLWDDKGNPIERGQGDEKFEFKVEGWNGEETKESKPPVGKSRLTQVGSGKICQTVS